MFCFILAKSMKPIDSFLTTVHTKHHDIDKTSLEVKV